MIHINEILSLGFFSSHGHCCTQHNFPQQLSCLPAGRSDTHGLSSYSVRFHCYISSTFQWLTRWRYWNQPQNQTDIRNSKIMIWTMSLLRAGSSFTVSSALSENKITQGKPHISRHVPGCAALWIPIPFEFCQQWPRNELTTTWLPVWVPAALLASLHDGRDPS